MNQEIFEFREAQFDDIPQMKYIRDHVRENVLVTIKVEIPDYKTALFQDGKGWVCVASGKVVGFSCGRLKQKDVWALFVDQQYESKGIGNRLMELLENWMFKNGCEEIVLSTEAGTRAEKLYRKRKWRYCGVLPSREVEFRLQKPSSN